MTQTLVEIFWFLLVLMLSLYLSYFASMYILSRRRLKFIRKGSYPSVSLIIPTYNESKVILGKLNNVLELEYPKDKLEVVVVDSASEDGTGSIVQSFLNDHTNGPKMHLVSLKQRLGKASALNSIWHSCNGEIVAISDADCLLDRKAMSELVKPFGDDRIGVVTGSHVIVNTGESAAKELEQSYRSIFNVLRLGESYLDSTPIVNGQLCAYRRDCIENLSTDSVCDDIELALRIRRKGYRIIYEPSAIFFEFTPRKFSARFAQKTRRAQGIVQQLLRFSNMLFNRTYGIFAFLILPFEFFFHIVSPLMLIALLILFVLSISEAFFVITISMMLLIFLGITGAFSLLRYLNASKVNLISIALTFFESQAYLFLGLLPLLAGRTSHKWKIIDEVRDQNTQSNIGPIPECESKNR